MGLKFILPKNHSDAETYKGVHLPHPILPDDTLCGIAISDNFENFDVEITNQKVSCKSCLSIIKFCKQY